MRNVHQMVADCSPSAPLVLTGNMAFAMLLIVGVVLILLIRR